MGRRIDFSPANGDKSQTFHCFIRMTKEFMMHWRVFLAGPEKPLIELIPPCMEL
jgi:hypothetical protein